MNSKKLDVNLDYRDELSEGTTSFLNDKKPISSKAYLLTVLSLALVFLGTTLLPSKAYATNINDTGVVGCANDATNNLACPQADFPNQDAQQGRDVTDNDDSDGHAGFSYTKLDANGNDLAADAVSWSCVRDNVTNLIWEMKNSEVWDLQDKSWTYTWYNSSGINDGGLAGTEHEDGECVNDDYLNCNAEDYVNQVNVQTFCGHNDWRLPSRNELISLLRFDQADHFINSDYFPNTKLAQYNRYWSATPSSDSINAWMVDYEAGSTVESPKYFSGYIRLVRRGE
jgi:hypothetical protein